MACRGYGLLLEEATLFHQRRLAHEYDRAYRDDQERDGGDLGVLECNQRNLPKDLRRPYVPICHRRRVQSHHGSRIYGHQFHHRYRSFYP